MKTIAENERLQFVTDVPRYNREKVVVHQKKSLDQRATFAQELMRAWGMVASRAPQDGEYQDKNGLALMPPGDVVTRACEITDLAFNEFDKRGWTLTLPSYDKLEGLSED